MKRFSTIIALVIICLPAFSSGDKYLKIEASRLSGSPSGDKTINTSGITSESLYGNYSKLNGFSIGTSYLVGYNIEVGAAFSHSSISGWDGPSENIFAGATSQVNLLHAYSNLTIPFFHYNVINTVSLYLGGILSYGSMGNNVHASFVKNGESYEFKHTESSYLYKRNVSGAGLRFGVNIDIPYYNLGINIGKSFNMNKVKQKGFIYDDAINTSLWEVGLYFKIHNQSRRIIK